MSPQRESSQSTIDYDTQWKHEFLKPDDYPTFKAKTPVHDIVPQLEKRLNQTSTSLNVHYTPESITTFYRLYRNVIPNYKGWQVYYREPNSPEKEYSTISVKIGYKPRPRSQSVKQMVFAKRMRWTHELYPMVQRVEINGAENLEAIATCLNDAIKQANLKWCLKNWLPALKALENNYKELDKQAFIGFTFQTNPAWHGFSKNLKTLNDQIKKLSVFNSNDYLVTSNNIGHVFQRVTKTAKGWRVEFLNKKW